MTNMGINTDKTEILETRLIETYFRDLIVSAILQDSWVSKILRHNISDTGKSSEMMKGQVICNLLNWTFHETHSSKGLCIIVWKHGSV